MAKIAILYSELADYSLACMKALKELNHELLLVHWPVNPEAPFKFDLDFIDHVIPRNKLSDQALLKRVVEFKPDIVLCSGWMDKTYMSISKQLKKKSTTVLSLDNHWTGSMKQRIATVIAPFTIKRSFSKAFVPGQVQKEYALKLGFSNNDIRTGFYSADALKFKGYFEEIERERNGTLPKRFLYLGRYVEHKGIFDVWNAFILFRENHPDWELWCVGTGDQFENRVEGKGIRHFGFVQPTELLPILKECGVYILPSHFEPWGVSVQEMAIAGFPMILSDAIGSKEAFLQEGVNGFVFQAGKKGALTQLMKRFADQSNQDLMKMAYASHTLGIKHSPEIWANSLMSLLDRNKSEALHE